MAEVSSEFLERLRNACDPYQAGLACLEELARQSNRRLTETYGEFNREGENSIPSNVRYSNQIGVLCGSMWQGPGHYPGLISAFEAMFLTD